MQGKKHQNRGESAPGRVTETIANGIGPKRAPTNERLLLLGGGAGAINQQDVSPPAPLPLSRVADTVSDSRAVAILLRVQPFPKLPNPTMQTAVYIVMQHSFALTWVW